MSTLRLETPGAGHEAQALALRAEHLAHGEASIAGSGRWSETPAYADWLDALARDADPARVEPGRVVGATYFVVRAEDNEIVGMVNLRHTLNDFLLHEGGHIGYSIRPSQRRQGYATQALALMLGVCAGLGLHRVLVTCNADNTASARTIQKNGGVLEDARTAGDGRLVQRYWINL